MKKILLIGDSAGVYVIGETLKKSGCKLFTYGKNRNPGLVEISEEFETGNWDDLKHIKEFASHIKPDFAVIGSTLPIEMGMTDALLNIGIKSIAPTKALAVLEFSKAFTRNLLKKYSITGNPDFKIFHNKIGIREYMEKLNGNYVVKADGLVVGGVGVRVSGEHIPNISSGVAYAEECLAQFGQVVVEEKMIGQEFSLMFFCDGKTLKKMPPVQDHKRAFEGDTGPNTAGMGSYSDANHLLPFLTAQDLDDAEKITYEVIKAFEKEMGEPYKGILYGGFMATAKGMRLLEYNVRVGDPEALNVFPLLQSNLIEIFEGVLNGTLSQLDVNFENKATVCKYIVGKGFPEKPAIGEKLTIGTLPKNVRVYPAIVIKNGEDYIITNFRSIALLGIGNTLEQAEQLAETACKNVKGPAQWRKDIGTQALIQERVEMMRKLRPI